MNYGFFRQRRLNKNDGVYPRNVHTCCLVIGVSINYTYYGMVSMLDKYIGKKWPHFNQANFFTYIAH